MTRTRAIAAISLALAALLAAMTLWLSASHPALAAEVRLPDPFRIGSVDVSGAPLPQVLAWLNAQREMTAQVVVAELGLKLPVRRRAVLGPVLAELEPLVRGGPWQRLRQWYALRRRGALALAYELDAADQAAARRRIEAALPQPVPARLEFDEEAVRIIPHRPGLIVTAAAWDDLWRRLEREGGRQRLALTETTGGGPTTADLTALRLEKLITSFSTRFDPANRERSHNIRLAAAAVDGTMLAPGQVFSFNEVVGPRTEERGYQFAPVILEGEFVPGVGGGVCQVSSTLHVAFLQAGLERIGGRNHSIPINYLPLGWDAAVADWLDLKYRNNTGGHIYIAMDVPEPGRLRVRLYGAANVPRYRIETRVTADPLAIRYEQDPSLLPGQSRVLAPGRPAYTVETYLVAEDGRRVFSHRSRYLGEPRRVAVAQAAAAPGSSTQ
ncbi:MAG TPA: VanW family protein [Bacillota bacterium]